MFSSPSSVSYNSCDQYMDWADPYANVRVDQRVLEHIHSDSDNDWDLCILICAIVQCALAMLCLADFPWSECTSQAEQIAEEKIYPIRNPFPNPRNTSNIEFSLKQIISSELNLSRTDFKVHTGTHAFIKGIQSEVYRRQLTLKDISEITINSTKVKQEGIVKTTTIVLDAFPRSPSGRSEPNPLFSHLVYS